MTANRSKGFTLMELMIALAIIAILGSIGIPAYNNYVMKAQRTEARKALAEVALAQERAYSINGRYANTLGDLATAIGVSSATAPFNGASADIDSKFTITLTTANNNQTFTVTSDKDATELADVLCDQMSVDQLGTQSAGGHEDECF